MHGEIELRGVVSPNPTIQCWPEPVPYIFNGLFQMLKRRTSGGADKPFARDRREWSPLGLPRKAPAYGAKPGTLASHPWACF
jgi:hypothetical protein